VADYSLKDHKGGAQQTNDVMIKAGRERGHTIELATGGAVIDSKGVYDAVILNNRTKYDRGQIESLTDSYTCIRYEHDYWVARNYPELYEKVKHTIFLSPFHKESIEEEAKIKIKNFSLVPSPIDSKKFSPKGEKERNSVLWVGNFCEDKGSKGFLGYVKDNPNFKFYVAGWGADIPLLEKIENVEFIGELDTKELIEYYQKCEYFYHRPVWNEPFGRTVLEAYFCGCNLLLNGNIGAMSWDWDYGNYDEIKKNVQSEDKFWKIIENEV
jgi:glycosyltransferase involved in cell wall biosynthesis